ncbi:PD-(D/E)XK nuclease domain-containing protein [Agriterribacter humi]|uniref:PD-(D/E)XK nuclease domain-containing protein n=1 Tax=Agriterribacter humi TaxID=1104781 RepID=UPI0012643541|nr:hypothetical protein [Agriterribacter humi]
MVYLEQYIKNIKDAIQPDNLGSMAYYYHADKTSLKNLDLSSYQGQDLIAAKGYCGIDLAEEEKQKILRPGFKGIDISSTIFKLVGAYFAHSTAVSPKFAEKFQDTSLRNKYFISVLVSDYRSKLVAELTHSQTSENWLYRFLLGLTTYENDNLEELQKFLITTNDVIDLIILEELRRKFLSQEFSVTSFINLSAKEIILQVLANFQNATNKITQVRRAGRSSFEIKDEYDVQDLLYSILKGIFPLMKEEDPVPRQGAKSSRIDLIVREEGILIEVKMIKEADSNEKEFVEQLKTDIQSYHKSEWLKYLICFVYDPHRKTKDKQSFFDLNGTQSVNGKQFTIDIILNPM